MIQASGRLLRLLALLQSRSTWAGTDLAARLEVTARTLRRDIERLRALGYPIDATRGVAGGYALGAEARLPPLSFDADEATAVFVGLHAAVGTGITGAGSAALRALGKLDRVLPSRLRRNFRALQGSVIELATRSRPFALSSISTLAGACADRHAVQFAYATRGTATMRTVEPIRIVHVGGLWYLVAWDRDRQDWRTFRLDRMRDVEASGERFAARPPPDPDLAAYVTRAISSAPHPYRAKVRLHAAIAAVRPRVGAFDAHFAPAGERRCTMEVGAPTLDVLVARILWLGIDFDVIDGPPALRAHLEVIARRIAKAAREGGTSPNQWRGKC